MLSTWLIFVSPSFAHTLLRTSSMRQVSWTGLCTRMNTSESESKNRGMGTKSKNMGMGVSISIST